MARIKIVIYYYVKKIKSRGNMKKIKIYGLLIVAIMLFSTCKKDYPDDIPQWVKDKIKYCVKKKNDCAKLIIKEYSYNGNLYYNLRIPVSAPTQNDYYNEEGELVCSDVSGAGLVDCGGFTPSDLIFIRKIWQED
jgi:hypothetical protein